MLIRWCQKTLCETERSSTLIGRVYCLFRTGELERQPKQSFPRNDSMPFERVPIGRKSASFKLESAEKRNSSSTTHLCINCSLCPQCPLPSKKLWKKALVYLQYLGELVRVILLDLCQRGILFGPEAVSILKTPSRSSSKGT